jgi:hypothetical protein
MKIKHLAGFRDWLASGADPGRVYSEFLTKRSSGADETIFLALRSPPEMNTGYQPTLANRGTGHVGIHHQRALSAGLQAISERDANAASSLGLKTMASPVNIAIYIFGGFMLFALTVGFLAAPV